MLQLTVRELLEATQTGALGRLLSLPKPVPVAWANRKAAQSADNELRLFNERKSALVKECGGELPDGAREYEFPSKEAKARYVSAMDELLAQSVDIDAVKLQLSDLRGDLSESDLVRLERLIAG